MGTMWSDDEKAEVKRIFGEAEIYGFALTNDPRLVGMIRSAVTLDHELEAVIQQLTSDGDESRVDVERANRLLQALIARRDGRKLLQLLEQNENYQRIDSHD